MWQLGTLGVKSCELHVSVILLAKVGMLHVLAATTWCRNTAAMLIISLIAVVILVTHSSAAKTCMPAKQMRVNQLPWDQGFLPGKELIKSSCWSRKLCFFLLTVWSFEGFWLEISSRKLLVSVAEASVHILPSLSISLLVLIGRTQPDTRRFRTWSLCVCHRWGWKREKKKERVNMEAISGLFFRPSPFKSTLRRAPVWPLMLPLHLAKRSGETQDHRNGQKQFHPLSESISRRHSEREKNRNQICSTLSKTLVKLFE